MEPLFEAKTTFDERMTLYNIFRIGKEKYKAEMVNNKNDRHETTAPRELILTKNNYTWQTENSDYAELGATLGAEIDAFNNGYGDLLGRIGVR